VQAVDKEADMRRVLGTWIVAGSLGIVVLGAHAQTAAGLDLTGEWHGTEICDEVDGGRRNVFVEQSPIFIQQRPNGRFLMLFRLDNGNADVVYEGIVQQVAAGGHEAVAIACGGNFRSQEVIRFRPITAPGAGGLFNGESQFFTNDFPGSGGVTNFGTCKYAYERVSTVRPTVRSCPRSPITGRLTD
jgi:hypothetical protein